MRHTTTAITALLLLTLGAEPVAADSLTATLGQPLKEVAHKADIRLKNGVAIFRVRRTFANAGTKHEEARLTINLPYGAAATGLRIRGKKQWFKGELMERNKAAELYQKLTGIGPHEPRDPALLSWNWANELQLNVFPVPPGKKATVEYTLTVPTHYSRGRYTLSYPRHNGAKNLAVPILRIHPDGKKRTRITVNGKRTTRGQSVALRQAVVKTLPGHLERDTDASYVVSTLPVRRGGYVESVEVSVDIRHTYKSDLKVQLVTPEGEAEVLHDKTGGSGNNIRKNYKVELDEPTPVAGKWHLVVSDHAGRDVGQLVAWSVRGKVGRRKFRYRARGLPLVLPDAPASTGDLSQAIVRLAPKRINTLSGRLGRVVASKKKQFLRMELDMAPQLRPLPRHLSVVFVVDASISIKEDGIKEQLALARAYLAHVPRARFEVVLYRRFAKRLVGSFARAGTFPAQVKTANKRGLLEPGNGSALDEGLALAAKILRHRRGKRRIVMLSDNLLKPSWTNARALRALARAPRGTIAHVVLPKFESAVDDATERRNDKHRLSPLATKTGGVLLHITAPQDVVHKKLVPVVLGLVRPIRIDHVRFQGFPAKHGIDLPLTLNEGTGLREMTKLVTAPRAITIVGQIWSSPYKKVIRVDKSFTRATAAFVFSHDQHKGLTNAEMMRVAKLGRAVSPVTSYLAIEPGVRPSRAGIDRSVGFGGFGAGGGGGGGGGGFGLGGWGRTKYPTLNDLMKPHVLRCVARHKPAANWQVRLRFHATYDEVVDVLGRSKNSALQKCLVEGAWQIRLPGNFTKERDTKDITLP